MNKLYILLLLSIVIPFLHGNQTIDVNVPYLMTFVNNSTYDLDTGAITSDTDFARTDKKINRNSILYVDDIDKITHVLFWDNLDQYIGYYNTPNTNITSTEFITAVSGNEFAPPSNAYYFAFVINKTTFNTDTIITALNNKTLNEVFVGGNLDLTITHDIDDLYWKTDGNVSSLNNYYFVVGKNLFDGSIGWVIGTGLDSSGNTVNASTLGYNTQYVNVIPNTNIVLSSTTNISIYRILFYDINKNFIVRQEVFTSPYTFTIPSNAYYIRFTFNIITGATTPLNFQLELGNTATTYESFLLPTISVNLTSLGIASLTQAQMDAYFEAWQSDEFSNGITFATFETAESYYRQTFYDPLPNDTIALIVSGILGIGLMLLGFITKARIFNLFSIAPFTVFGLLLPNPAIIIAMVGLIIYQVYYAFWSKT